MCSHGVGKRKLDVNVRDKWLPVCLSVSLSVCLSVCEWPPSVAQVGYNIACAVRPEWEPVVCTCREVSVVVVPPKPQSRCHGNVCTCK